MYNFPKTKTPIRWGFALKKVCFFVVLWFVGYIIGKVIDIKNKSVIM
jgi:hypothetical protein